MIGKGVNIRIKSQIFKDKITQMAWSTDGNEIILLSEEGILHRWDLSNNHYYPVRGIGPGSISNISWCPEGSLLAVGRVDGVIRLWSAENWQEQHRVRDIMGRGFISVAWSPDHKTIALVLDDHLIRFWDLQTGQLTLQVNPVYVNFVAWSPDGQTLAGIDRNGDILLWDKASGQAPLVLATNIATAIGSVNWTWQRQIVTAKAMVTWAPDGKTLASQDGDFSMIWDATNGRQLRILESHTQPVIRGIFSSDGRFFVTASLDKTIRIWRCDTWDSVGQLPLQPRMYQEELIGFHPQLSSFAVIGDADARVVDLDPNLLSSEKNELSSVHYTNAKVVLVGDTGVGKSGMGLVLTGNAFTPTDSTHGRHVWTFDSQHVHYQDGRDETRETFLWDLAGQPDYRLIHQLHLHEVTVALVMFDSRGQLDPFAGVHHWNRALRQSQRLLGKSALPMKKFLVAARADVGLVGVSKERIEILKNNLGFDDYFETSAKEGWNITELSEAIRTGINWEALPKVTSTELLQSIKAFIIGEKQVGRQLTTVNDLYHSYFRTVDSPSEFDSLRAQFETSIGRLEAQGLIRRLSFGGLVLLQPELLDAYASAMVNAAKREPDGLGYIPEDEVQSGLFRMPDDERIKDREQEKLLLIATIEDLLRHEIALREQADLVFPTQLTRENPDLPDPEGKTVTYRFEGPVLNVYATLAVRLAHSGFFHKKEMWKNATTYTTVAGGVSGMFIREIEEGKGELSIFFDTGVSEDVRSQFDRYILVHIQRRALSGTIERRPIFGCSNCGLVVTDQLFKMLTEARRNSLSCPVCQNNISLLDKHTKDTLSSASGVLEMNRFADNRRERDAAVSVIDGKRAVGDFDVFLCHNSEDKPVIRKIAQHLMENGILPWLDEWELQPGLPWQKTIDDQIRKIKSAAVFLGPSRIGPWQDREQEALLNQFVKRNCPVIPIVLPGKKEGPWLLEKNDIKDAAGLAVKLRESQDAISTYIRNHIRDETCILLGSFSQTEPTGNSILEALLNEANNIIEDPNFYDKRRFAEVILRKETSRMIKQSFKDGSTTRMNRLLLEDAYPQNILKSHSRLPHLPVFLENLTWIDFRRRVPDPFERLIWGITGQRNS